MIFAIAARDGGAPATPSVGCVYARVAYDLVGVASAYFASFFFFFEDAETPQATPSATTTRSAIVSGDAPTATTTTLAARPTAASQAVSSATASAAEASAASRELPRWLIAVVGCVGLLCAVCVLYFVSMALAPPRYVAPDDGAVDAALAKLEAQCPDVDVDQLRHEIYAQLPTREHQYASAPHSLAAAPPPPPLGDAAAQQALDDVMAELREPAPRGFFNPVARRRC